MPRPVRRSCPDEFEVSKTSLSWRASTRTNVLAATTTTAASATPHQDGRPRRCRACGPLEGRLDVVDEHQLSGYVEIVLVDEHVDRTHGIQARRRLRAARQTMPSLRSGRRGPWPRTLTAPWPGAPFGPSHPWKRSPECVLVRASAGSVGAMERRIFGLENEYGVTCTLRGQRRLSPDEVARYLFRRVVSWGRSSQRLPRERRPALPRRRQPPRVRHARVRLDLRPRRPRQGGGADPRELLGQRRAAPARRGHPRRHLPLQEQHRLGRQLLRLPRELPHRAGATTSATSPRCSSRSS